MDQNSFRTLPELVGYLRNELSNVSAREALEGLQEVVGNEVTIRYEIIDEPGVASAREEISTVPKSKYANVDGKKLSRILLTSYKRRADLSTELYRQLNGIVLQFPGWKVLAVPGSMFNQKPRESEIVKNLSDYDIYPIIDGTVVTLYWYESGNNPGSWRLSSTNGFDVTDYCWMSGITYFNAIMKIAERYPQFSLARLNKSCSYTIGFRHHDFHPMRSDPEKLWFIQSCNLIVLNNLLVTPLSASQFLDSSASKTSTQAQPMLIINNNCDIGIPIQRPLLFNTDDGVAIMAMLQQYNDNSLDTFMRGAKGDFINEPHYGYFLRPKAHRLDLYDIMFESKVLNLLRKTMYNFPKKRALGDGELTASTRVEYAILRAYLGINIRYPFITLFPQYESTYKRYDDLFNKIASRIIQIISKRNDKKHTDNRIETLAQSFADHIKSTGVNVTNSEGLNIILSFLRDQRYLELYFNAIVIGKK